MMGIAIVNLYAGWLGMLGGVISGSVVGHSFHREEWLGGYSSFQRRLVRLGHISFFGIGLINIAFALTVWMTPIPIVIQEVASFCFVAAIITMPLCCFLTAWRPSLRLLFPIPVVCALIGIVSLVIGMVLQLMRESGCAQVLIGFESPSFPALDGLELRSNWKAKQLDRYCRAVEKIQDHGITVNGCFILGIDGSGSESFDAVWNFARDSGLYEVQITILTPFPGAPLYDRLKKEGRLVSEGAWELCTLFDVNFRPDGMSVTELETGFRNLAEKLYSDTATRERREKYGRRLRASRRGQRND